MIGLGGRIGDDVLERLEELVGDLPAEATGPPDAAVLSENGEPGPDPHEAVGPGAPRDRRAAATRTGTPIATPCSSSRRSSAAACRRGSSPRCASGAGSRTTSSAAPTRYADAGTLAAQAGVDLNRIDEAVETIVAELRRVVAEAVPADELEKARAFAKGRFVLGLESPHATIMFGLRREVLEGRAVEPDGGARRHSTPSRSTTSSASPPTSSAASLRLAVIGPFDEPERFERLSRRRLNREAPASAGSVSTRLPVSMADCPVS